MRAPHPVNVSSGRSWTQPASRATSAPAASAASELSRTSGCWRGSWSLHAVNYYAYGYRRMWKALLRDGEQVPRCRIQRLMRTHGIVGGKRRGRPWRTTRPDPDAHRRPDLVQRNFTARGPDELWVADLSYLRCWAGLVFFAFVIDAYRRGVVGWQVATHMRTTLVLDTL
jgi:putative transposase